MMIRQATARRIFNAIRPAAAIGLFLLVSVTVAAQGAPGQISTGPLDQILAKLDEILAVLNPPSSSDVVLTTPILEAGATQATQCLIANVGSTSFTYTYRIVTNSGATGPLQGSSSLQPGRGDVSVVGTGGLTQFRCEFRITGAPASSVRASIAIEGATGGSVATADAR